MTQSASSNLRGLMGPQGQPGISSYSISNGSYSVSDSSMFELLDTLVRLERKMDWLMRMIPDEALVLEAMNPDNPCAHIAQEMLNERREATNA